MLTLEEAIDLIRPAVPLLPAERIPLSQSSGRIARERLASKVDLPGFDNSAMDGYAVRAADLSTANSGQPISLDLCGRVAAGEIFHGRVPAGTCVRVFTGSPLPEGADAVVMQEDIRIDPGDGRRVQFFERVKPWENIRIRGEDVKSGDVLVEAGDRLKAGRIGLLAAAGFKSVAVGRRPVVGLLATGSELSEDGATPVPGKIHESNRLMLAALCEGAGAIPLVLPLVRDSLAETQAALAEAFAQCDAVVSSGGVSVGEYDFVKSAFEHLGGRIDLWRIAIKPGKPFLSGRLGDKTFFGLPGNPVSAFVTFLLLVRPALLWMQGAASAELPRTTAVLSEDTFNPGDRRQFMRMVVDPDGRVRSAGAQSSNALMSLARANALLDVPPRTRLTRDTPVIIWRID